ncbi:hypothetical protein Emed_006659 [Eimeria media]
MEGLRAPPSYESRLPSKGFGLEWESGTLTSLHGRSRTPHAASHSSYLITSQVVILLTLAVAYLLWGCFRALYVNSSLGGTVRALAGKDSPDESCPGGSDNAGGADDEGAAEPEADDRSREGRATSSKRGRGARGKPSPFQHRLSKSFIRGWAVQEMPLEWMEKTRRSLHKLKDVALKCASLMDVLHARESVDLVMHLASLAVVELAGFGHIPQNVQGVRWAAGRAYVVLIERIFKIRKLRMACMAANCEQRLESIRVLLREISEVPQRMQFITPLRFKECMVRHWELNKRTTQHLGYHLDLLLASSRERGSGLQAQLEMVMRVIKALFETRKMQLLGDGVLRRWLGACHKKAGRDVLYTRDQYEQARGEGLGDVSAHLDRLTAAVVEAGGSAELPSFFNTFPSSSGTSPPRPSPPISAEAVEGAEAGQGEQQPSSGEYEQAASSVGAQHQLPERRDSPLLASMRLVGRQEHARPPQTQEYYAALGARPRRSASEEAEAARVNEQAQAIGWGPRRMPPQVATQVLLVLDRIERAAGTCEFILTSMSPENAVSLSMHLTMWAVVEIASFPLVPEDMQEKRRRAAMRYVSLIDSVLSDENTAEAARSLEVDGKLVLLQSLLEEITKTPDEPSDMDANKYMMVVMTAWRLSNYSSRNVQGLVGSIWPTRNVRGTSRGNPQVIASVLGALCKLRTTQLLADANVSSWFVTCHGNVTPGLFFTEEELDEARRSKALPIVKELNKLTKAIQKTQESATTTRAREASPEAGDGTSSQTREQLVAALTGAPLHLPLEFQPPVPRVGGRPGLGQELPQSAQLLQALELPSLGGYASLPHVQQTMTRRPPPRPSRYQPPDPQISVSHFLGRSRPGEREREPTSLPRTREMSSFVHPGPSTQRQVQLNPFAAEFLPRPLVSPIPRIPPRMEDPGQVFWSHPSTPPTPVPAVELPTIHHQPVPGWLDPAFPLAPAQTLEAAQRPFGQIPYEVPPSPFWELHPTPFSSTHVRPRPQQPSPASGLHPPLAYLPQLTTSPLPSTHPGEALGASGGEEALGFTEGIVWGAQGDEGGDISGLMSQLSTFGGFEEEEEEQFFED